MAVGNGVGPVVVFHNFIPGYLDEDSRVYSINR
jgi:hypothetical protein